MIRPLVFTQASNGAHPGLARRNRSLERWGWEYETYVGEWRGDVYEHSLMEQNTPRWRDAGYTHVLKIDAFDMICVGPPSDLESAYAHYGNPYAIGSAEIGCWPGDYRRADYGPPEHPWWFPHSPLSYDLRRDIPQEWWDRPNRGYGSDQWHLGDLFLAGKIALDRDQLIVMSTGHAHPWEKWFAVEGDRVRNLNRDTLGLFVHGNGRTDISWVPGYGD